MNIMKSESSENWWGSRRWLKRFVRQPLSMSVCIGMISVSGILIGLRLIVWMQESENRMWKMEQAISAITTHTNQAQDRPAGPKTTNGDTTVSATDAHH
jgi:hypothetical protein